MRNIKTKIHYDSLGMIFVLGGSTSAIVLLTIALFDISFFPMYLIVLSVLMIYTGIGFVILGASQLFKKLSDMNQKLMLMIDQCKEKEKEIITLYQKIFILNCIIRQQIKNRG